MVVGQIQEPAPQAGQTVDTPDTQPATTIVETENVVDTKTADADANDWKEEEKAFEEAAGESMDVDGAVTEPTEKEDGQSKEGTEPKVKEDDQKKQEEKEAEKLELNENKGTEEEGNWWSADDVKLPDDLSDAQKLVVENTLNKKLRKVQGAVGKKYQVEVREKKAFQGAWREQMSAFAQIAKAAPEERMDVVNSMLKHYTPTLKKYGIEVAGGVEKEQGMPPELTELSGKIADADTPEEAAELMNKRDTLMFEHFNTILKNSAKKTREESVKETQNFIRPIQEDRRKVSLVNSWSAVLESVRSGNNKLDEVDKHLPKIMEYIYGNDDKSIAPDGESQIALMTINRNPRYAAQIGITRESVLRRAHEKLTLPNRLETAKKQGADEILKQLKESGELPGQYISTNNSEGKDWDELEKDYNANS